MTYEMGEHRQIKDQWHVEAVGPDGEVYVAMFSGSKAKERAKAYLNLSNTIGLSF